MPVKGWALSSGKNMSALAQQLIVNMLEDLDGTAFERLQILLHQKAQPWAKSKSKSTISVGLKKHECNPKNAAQLSWCVWLPPFRFWGVLVVKIMIRQDASVWWLLLPWLSFCWSIDMACTFTPCYFDTTKSWQLEGQKTSQASKPLKYLKSSPPTYFTAKGLVYGPQTPGHL